MRKLGVGLGRGQVGGVDSPRRADGFLGFRRTTACDLAAASATMIYLAT